VSDRDALFRAVPEYPDEDTPRLALADWLDEHGGPADRARARFIRLQCDLARADAYTPARRDLVREAAALRDTHGKDWGAFPEGLVVAVRFGRGFVEEVTAYSKRFVADGAELFAAHPVRAVKFVDMTGGRGAAPPADLFACPQLARLRSADFSGRPVDDAFAAELARSPHLTGLRRLGLHRSSLTPKGLRSVLEAANLPNLTELDLSDSLGIGSAHLAAVAASPSLARLKSLDLLATVVGEDGARALAKSKPAAGLEVLRIGRHLDAPPPPAAPAPLRGPGAVAVAAAPHLRGLKELVLHGQELRKKGAEALAAAYAWPDLRRLALRRNDLPASALAAFAANPALRTLAEFELRESKIGRRDLGPLTAAFPDTAVLTDEDFP
jgi:uncharacterized protein (TIGR02996 family)